MIDQRLTTTSFIQTTMDDILAELRKIPPVTRFMVASSVAVSLPVMTHILSPYKVVYTASYVFTQGHVSAVWL